MFKFLKDKLKTVVSKLSKQVDEEAEPIKEEEAKPPKEHGEPVRVKKEEKTEEPAEETAEKKPEPKKRGFFGKLFGRKEKEQAEEEMPAEEKEVEPEKEPEAKDDVEEFREELEEVKPADIEAEEHELEEEKVIEEEPEEEKQEQPEEEKELEKDIEEEEKAEPGEEVIAEEKKPAKKPAKEEDYFEEEPEAKKGFFGKIKESITKKAISEEKFETIFWELEVALMENNVAVEVIGKIKEDLRKELVDKKVLRGRTEEIILNTLKHSVRELFSVEGIDLPKSIMEKKDKPYVIVFVGINGTGKTTAIAKVARLLQKKGISCAIAAADTFRAAAIQQIEEHADKLGVKLIKHDYGSDPAAVAFDTIKYAQAKNISCVLIDTAGRLHSNTNLMDEMKKIIRVAKPDLKVFVGDSLTGNDCVEQSREFNAAIGIDAIILAKADVDEKGGAALSVSYITKKPIIYLGVGQTYDSLEPFDSEKIIERLGLEA